MTVYTAIIGKYDDLKEPIVVTPGWNYVCFTDQDLKSDVWEIRKVPVMPFGPAKTARYIKIMFHEFINDEFSLWIDGTFVINCDLNHWWGRFSSPFTTVSHPFDRCVYTEIQSCLRGGKGNSNTLRDQMQLYSRLRVPKNNGLIASGVLMRENTQEVRKFCRAWWNEVNRFTERDQIAFAYVNFIYPNSHNSIEWNYTRQQEFIHVPHLHKTCRLGKVSQVVKMYESRKKS